MRLSSSLPNHIFKTSTDEGYAMCLGRLFHSMIVSAVKNVLYQDVSKCNVYVLPVFSM